MYKNENSLFSTKKTLNLKGNLIALDKPKIMGILNLTPDSFYDGGKHKDRNLLITVEKMLEDGVDIIDIGGYSSRPDAENITEIKELKRIIPSIEKIVKNFPEVYISIDTFRAKVAKNAIEAGACMINDISAGQLDKQMFQTVADLQVPYILMHMRGTPQTMKNLNQYNNILLEILSYFEKRVSILNNLGVKDIILDLGFGFAKNIKQNFFLLKNAQYFNLLNLAMLVGISRKSLIYKTLKVSPNEALNGTSVLNTVALMKNASFLRVHDVREAREVLKLIEV